MNYVEGVDYWVYLVEFPNMASPSVAVSNGDGTFSIYVNSRCSPERRAAGLRHELEHLAGEHFYRDDVELNELEAAANGLLKLSPPARAPQPGPDGRDIPLYESADEFFECFLRSASPESLRLLHRSGLLPQDAEPAANVMSAPAVQPSAAPAARGRVRKRTEGATHGF